MDIKILIVDDSPTEAAIIQHIIASAKDMSVIGIAKNGEEAIEMCKKLEPDLITMDIQMPVMDGLEATRIIMAENPTPIVVISALVNDESMKAIFHIIQAGALTALAKPVDIFDPSFAERREYILNTLRSLAQIRVTKKDRILKPINITTKPIKKSQSYEILAIGASVGGPIALKTILSQLPTHFSIPIVVVQHMSPGFIHGFTHWLVENTHLKIKEITNHEVLESGTVYIAPEQKHLEIQRVDHQLVGELLEGDSNTGFCPSINRLLRSVARVSGSRAIGLLLTGMSDDGAQGLLELKKVKGQTLVQGPESAIVFGMGAVAQSLNAVNAVVELEDIATYLKDLIE